MTNNELDKAKEDYLDIVIGKRLSDTWPNHNIYDIIFNERDGIQVPHVIGRNKNNPRDREYKKPLDTWLTDNGY